MNNEQNNPEIKDTEITDSPKPCKEHEKSFLASAYAFGMYAVIAACIALALIDIILIKTTSTFNYAAILFSFVATTQFYRYKGKRQNKDLIIAIAATVAAIASLVAYIAQGI